MKRIMFSFVLSSILACLLTAPTLVRADAATPPAAIKAFALAYGDFVKSLPEFIGTRGNQELIAFLLVPSNYKILVEDTPEGFNFVFRPEPYQGTLTYGTIRYVISPDGESILQREQPK